MVRLSATLESAKVPVQPKVNVALGDEVARVSVTLVSFTVFTDMVASVRPAQLCMAEVR
jgi:hypothetical protein